GNSGPARYTVGSPGAAEKALTVGAMGDPGELGYFLADFSSRGYTADGRIKPDIAAPGYNITAPKANTSSGYVTYSGTSMATPFDYGYGNLNGYEAVKKAGGFSGTGPAQPAHLYGSGSLGGTGAYDQFAVDVTDASKPLAITLIMPNWSSSTNPDFDLYLYNSSGTLVARSEGTKRQETIRYQPSVTGTYTIRVSSYTGSGSYFFDVSVGGGNLRQTVNQ
ncbi:S8 family serine peptidase, partial [Calditerricola satsumensis]